MKSELRLLLHCFHFCNGKTKHTDRLDCLIDIHINKTRGILACLSMCVTVGVCSERGKGALTCNVETIRSLKN